MPGQLIFASVPAGLAAGRSGYCTVARSRSLGDRLVVELEKLSAHEPGLGEAYAFRHVRAGGETYAVITRYADAGPDYTGRASTIAHHLVFRFTETVAAPPPADLARRFGGWRGKWEGAAAWLEEDTRDFRGAPAALPASEWKRVTGDAGPAAGLCDDRGAPRASGLPATTVPGALALWSESALLTSDRGWGATFSTRAEPLDAGALWRLRGPVGEVSPRRAVMARTGILPGAAPGAMRAGGGAGLASVIPVESSPGWKRHLPTGLAALGGTVVMGALAWYFFSKPEEPEPERPPVLHPVKPDPKPAVLSAAVTAALGAADRGDWPEFARRLSTLSAEERGLTAVTERAYRMRSRLFADGMARSLAAVESASAPIPAKDRTVMATGLDELENLAARLGVEPGAEDRVSLARLRSTLAAMSAVEASITPGLWLGANWVPDEETPLALTRRLSVANPQSIAEFLAAAKAPVSGRLESVGSAARPWPLVAEAKDVAAGRILVLRHAEYGKVLELRAEANDRTGVSLRTLRTADAAYADSARILSLELTDAEGRRLAVRFMPSGASFNAVMLPASVLRRTPTGAVALPAWIEGGLSGVTMAPGGARALLPDGYASAPRDFPGMPVSVAAVTQGIRTRLVPARAEGAPASEIQKLESRLAAAPEHPVESGSPWGFVLAPAGVEPPMTLIRFVP